MPTAPSFKQILAGVSRNQAFFWEDDLTILFPWWVQDIFRASGSWLGLCLPSFDLSFPDLVSHKVECCVMLQFVASAGHVGVANGASKLKVVAPSQKFSFTWCPCFFWTFDLDSIGFLIGWCFWQFWWYHGFAPRNGHSAFPNLLRNGFGTAGDVGDGGILDPDAEARSFWVWLNHFLKMRSDVFIILSMGALGQTLWAHGILPRSLTMCLGASDKTWKKVKIIETVYTIGPCRSVPLSFCLAFRFWKTRKVSFPSSKGPGWTTKSSWWQLIRNDFFQWNVATWTFPPNVKLTAVTAAQGALKPSNTH